jgi:hypothetical protein
VLWDNVKKHSKARQSIQLTRYDACALHTRKLMLHTHRICNTYCFSTAIIVTRTRPSVIRTLPVLFTFYWRPCCNWIGLIQVILIPGTTNFCLKLLSAEWIRFCSYLFVQGYKKADILHNNIGSHWHNRPPGRKLPVQKSHSNVLGGLKNMARQYRSCH